MASLAAAYWMGLAAANSARDHQRMWNIATRATQRQQAPVDDRAILIDQVAQLQAQLQQALAEQDALRTQCDVNYRAWLAETTSHRMTQATLDATVSMWTPPQRRSHP